MVIAEQKLCELAVIGAGAAGLAAALAAAKSGVRAIALIDREREPGGILNQCIHTGFGLEYFGDNLSGPEYAGRFVRMLEGSGIELLSATTAVRITPELEVYTLSRAEGYRIIRPKAIILATGCRERTRFQSSIPGTRPAGIFTAGTAQRYVNVSGYMPGKRILIAGSGDIGLIMARRFTLEGAKVLGCVERLPHPGGLQRNVTQCLDDFDIPLYLSHTITEVRGTARVNAAVAAELDAEGNIVEGTEKVFDCDTILIATGLIPENELAKDCGMLIDPRSGGLVVSEYGETSVSGIFACGNALRVHSLADHVTREAESVAVNAAGYIKGMREDRMYTERIHLATESEFMYKPEKTEETLTELLCTICPRGCKITVDREMTIRGAGCAQGESFALREVSNPSHILTGTVAVNGSTLKRLPVKTAQPVPRAMFKELMDLLRTVTVIPPVREGQIITGNLLGTGVGLVATRDIAEN